MVEAFEPRSYLTVTRYLTIIIDSAPTGTQSPSSHATDSLGVKPAMAPSKGLDGTTIGLTTILVLTAVFTIFGLVVWRLRSRRKRKRYIQYLQSRSTTQVSETTPRTRASQVFDAAPVRSVPTTMKPRPPIVQREFEQQPIQLPERVHTSNSARSESQKSRALGENFKNHTAHLTKPTARGSPALIGNSLGFVTTPPDSPLQSQAWYIQGQPGPSYATDPSKSGTSGDVTGARNPYPLPQKRTESPMTVRQTPPTLIPRANLLNAEDIALDYRVLIEDPANPAPTHAPSIQIQLATPNQLPQDYFGSTYTQPPSTLHLATANKDLERSAPKSPAGPSNATQSHAQFLNPRHSYLDSEVDRPVNEEQKKRYKNLHQKGWTKSDIMVMGSDVPTDLS